jgi:hypothetical protein
MGSVIGFVDRVTNQEHILFRRKGVFLFSFPMFFIPLKEFNFFQEELSKIIGFGRVEEIFSNIGYLQGKFAMSYFEKTFNIRPSIKNFSFTAEQYQLLGLGKGEIITLEYDEITIKYNPFLEYRESFYDFYFSGMIEGTFSYYLKKELKVMDKKIFGSTNYFILKRTEVPKKKMLDTYISKNITIKEIPSEKNEFYEKNIHNSNFHIISKTGTFINNKNFTLNLMSMYISIYYFCIKENKKTKVIFEQLGKGCAREILNEFPNENANDKFNLMELFGFGTINIIEETNTSISLQFNADIFENISSNLFPKEYYIENNEFKFGFLEEIFKNITKATRIKREITSNNTSLQITLTKIQ